MKIIYYFKVIVIRSRNIIYQIFQRLANVYCVRLPQIFVFFVRNSTKYYCFRFLASHQSHAQQPFNGLGNVFILRVRLWLFFETEQLSSLLITLSPHKVFSLLFKLNPSASKRMVFGRNRKLVEDIWLRNQNHFTGFDMLV